MKWEEAKRLRDQGKQIKFAREYRGMTQTNLCKQIKGLNQSILSRSEKGFIDLPEDVKKNIMLLLGFPYGFLNIVVKDVSFLNYN